MANVSHTEEIQGSRSVEQVEETNLEESRRGEGGGENIND